MNMSLSKKTLERVGQAYINTLKNKKERLKKTIKLSLNDGVSFIKLNKLIAELKIVQETLGDIYKADKKNGLR